MGPKKGRRVRKIEVPTDSVPKFDLGDTAVDIQRRRDERKARTEETVARGGSCGEKGQDRQK